jgi:hypothetical protein
VLVEKHKNASIRAAGVALDEREEKICQQYLSFVRPSLVNHGETSPSNFLLNANGKKIENGSQTARRFLEKVFPNQMRPGVNVPNQTSLRHFIATINDRDEKTTAKEKEIMSDYLCHTGKIYFLCFILSFRSISAVNEHLLSLIIISITVFPFLCLILYFRYVHIDICHHHESTISAIYYVIPKDNGTGSSKLIS